ncbi:unnamed protein product [Closterium sp. Yama58-4]|nr:unnamed protein product [Closterium sp. Yama58-4]
MSGILRACALVFEKIRTCLSITLNDQTPHRTQLHSPHFLRQAQSSAVKSGQPDQGGMMAARGFPKLALLLLLAVATTTNFNPSLIADAQGLSASQAAYIASKAKALRAQANQAKDVLDSAQAVLDARLAEERDAAKKSADADAEAEAAMADLNGKKAALERAKQEQEVVRQATIQAKQTTKEEREYYDELDQQAQEALFDEAEAAKDIIDAQNRLETTKMIMAEQTKIAAEAQAEATSAARSAAKLGTPEAKAYQLEAYNIKLQSDRILVAVQKQAANADYRVQSRTTEHGNKVQDKGETRRAADEQKAIKEKAEKDEKDSFAMYQQKIASTKAADADVKASNAVAQQKLVAQRSAKAVLNTKVSLRASQERTVGALTTRYNSMKANADNAEADATKRGVKFND